MRQRNLNPPSLQNCCCQLSPSANNRYKTPSPFHPPLQAALDVFVCTLGCCKMRGAFTAQPGKCRKWHPRRERESGRILDTGLDKFPVFQVENHLYLWTLNSKCDNFFAHPTPKGGQSRFPGETDAGLSAPHVPSPAVKGGLRLELRFSIFLPKSLFPISCSSWQARYPLICPSFCLQRVPAPVSSPL